MAGAVMDDCPEIPDCIYLGWLWDPYADGGPAWLLYARWQDETCRHIEATWDDGVVSISW